MIQTGILPINPCVICGKDHWKEYDNESYKGMCLRCAKNPFNAISEVEE